MAEPTEVYPPDATLDALDGTVDSGTGLEYVPKGARPTDAIPLRRRFHRWVHRLILSYLPAKQARVVDMGGLDIGVKSIDYTQGGTHKSFAGSGPTTLSDNTTTKVWINASNAVTTGAAYPADITTFYRLASVVTLAGDITSITDERGFNDHIVPQSTTSSDTGTNEVSFTLDADNAGAGADQQVRFNRGSTDAEDAAVEWDEANDRFNFRKQHSTSTQAPINTSAVAIAGTTILDTNGVTKIAAGGVNGSAGLAQTAGVAYVKTATSSGTGFDGSGNLAIQANDGLVLSASGLDVDVKASDGVQISGGQLAAKVDDSTVAIDATNGLKVKDAGLAPVKTANYAATAGGVSFILTGTLVAGNTVTIHNADAPFSYRILDAWSVATSADAGTWKLENGATDITNAVTVTAADKTINRAGTIDDAVHRIAASGTLRCIGDGALADVIIYVLCMRVS